MILDSNILIYTLEPGYDSLRAFLKKPDVIPFISLITKLEVVGYHRLQPKHRQELERLLATSLVLPITEIVINEAIRLRQQRKRSLGDSIIAATALLYNLPVLTNNVADFTDIDSLQVMAMADVLNP